MEGGWWVAAGSIITAFIAAAGGVLINWMRERARTNQENLKATADRHEVLIDRQEKQIARMQAMVDQLHDSNRILREEHADCQAEQESLWVWLQNFHRMAVSMTKLLRAAQYDVDDVPPLPERRDTRGPVEYESRRIDQNTTLVDALRPPTPAPSTVRAPVPLPPVLQPPAPLPPPAPPPPEGNRPPDPTKPTAPESKP